MRDDDVVRARDDDARGKVGEEGVDGTSPHTRSAPRDEEGTPAEGPWSHLHVADSADANGFAEDAGISSPAASRSSSSLTAHCQSPSARSRQRCDVNDMTLPQANTAAKRQVRGRDDAMPRCSVFALSKATSSIHHPVNIHCFETDRNSAH